MPSFVSRGMDAVSADARLRLAKALLSTMTTAQASCGACFVSSVTSGSSVHEQWKSSQLRLLMWSDLPQ